MVSEFEVKVKSNFDEEIKKAKELVDLLERANELICTLGNRKIEVTLDGSSIAKGITVDDLKNTTIKELSETLIKLFCGDGKKGSCGHVKKSEIVEEISEILKNEEVERIDVICK
ncbi:MAG: hypothetical protein J6D03_06610 [Clostridia bacterium]|nr:hypothetical protein [Clostridia bacterium]